MTHLPLAEFYRRVALDAVSANDRPTLHLFRVTIGDNEPLTLSYPSSMAAWENAVEVFGPDARIDVKPLGADARVESFPLLAARQHLMLAKLREAARPAAHSYLTETEAGAFAIVPAAQLSQEQAEEVDRQYHAKKVSGALRERDDHAALCEQVMGLDAMRRAGWL